jgi:hypothetical protein
VVADLGVVARALVFATGGAEHDDIAAEFHVHVSDVTVRVGPAASFAESESLGDPVGGAGGFS